MPVNDPQVPELWRHKLTDMYGEFFRIIARDATSVSIRAARPNGDASRALVTWWLLPEFLRDFDWTNDPEYLANLHKDSPAPSYPVPLIPPQLLQDLTKMLLDASSSTRQAWWQHALSTGRLPQELVPSIVRGTPAADIFYRFIERFLRASEETVQGWRQTYSMGMTPLEWVNGPVVQEATPQVNIDPVPGRTLRVRFPRSEATTEPVGNKVSEKSEPELEVQTIWDRLIKE